MINIAERYFVYAVPLMVLLCAVIATPLPKSALEAREELLEAEQGWPPRYLPLRRRQRQIFTSMGAGLAVLLTLPGLFTSYHEIFRSALGVADAEQLAWIIQPSGTLAKKYRAYQLKEPGIVREAKALDALHAGRGGIMVDDALPCVPEMILASADGSQFTIPNDVNYTGLFGAPYSDGIRYMFVSDPHSATGALDSLDREFPTLYDSGAGLGTLVSTITIPACATYRLYRLSSNPTA